MKKRITMLVAFAIVAGAALNVAQAGKKKKKDAKQQPVEQPVKLTASSDSLSYAAGMSVTQGLGPYLKQTYGIDSAQVDDFMRGLGDMLNSLNDPKVKAYAAGMTIATQLSGQMLPNMKKEFEETPDSLIDSLVYRGFMDAMKGDTTVFTMGAAVETFKTKREINQKAKDEKLYGENRRAGEKFLAENATKDSVVTLPSGLQYKILVKGDGEVPQSTDRVMVNYEGRLVDGTVFDASSRHGSKPSTFRADQVIKGWTEALTMMPVGSKWQLFIPQQLAYGERNAGQIKPFSMLIFDVELVGIEGKTKPEAEPADEGKGKGTAPKPRKPARRK